MKKTAILATLAIMMIVTAFGQNISLESTGKMDTAVSEVSVQRIEISTERWNFKYDYKKYAVDVLGLGLNIYADSTTTLSAMVVKMGDHNSEDQYILDAWATKQLGNYNVLLEVGRMISPSAVPWDYAGTRIANHLFTAEVYALGYHSFNEEWSKDDVVMAWAAFHPKHAFVSVGVSDDQYWAFAGTKNLKHFGSFTFLNWQKNGNYWFRTQAGFGDINQGFFSQDLYIEATSYMVVPIFFYKHFSPISTKGTYAVKFDSKRNGACSTHELIMSKKIGTKSLAAAVGINSVHEGPTLRLAPSFEVYKDFKTEYGRLTLELRYDMVYHAFSAYTIIKF